ncbi:MAG: molybdenum cofactor biosynthesis protein MoaE [Microthrixaceae bacterium]
MTSLDGMRVASEESGAVDVGQSAEAPHGSGAVAALPAVAVIHAGLSDTPLDTQALVDLVRRADSGAIVVFEGTVRSPNHGHEVEALVYEAWLEKVPEQLHQIASEVAATYGLRGSVAVHRVGRVGVGEPAVVVVAVAVHRGAAFRGAEELINRVKSEAWIWKKEIRSNGEVWIEGC